MFTSEMSASPCPSQYKFINGETPQPLTINDQCKMIADSLQKIQ